MDTRSCPPRRRAPDRVTPLRIATIEDHLIGHTRQVEALVEAIADVRPVAVAKLRVRRWTRIGSHNIRRPLLARGWATKLLPLAVEGDWRAPADLVISGSGATTTANVLMKRLHGARNIFTGFVRGVRDGDIDCILAHQPAHATSPAHVLSPVPVLRFDAPRPGPFRGLTGATLAVVIGGEALGNGFDFDDGYCARLFPRLAAIDAAVGSLSWIVVTSRRTPAACYPAIEAFVAGAPRVDFVDFRSAGPGSLKRAYGCDGALVTEESKSMVSEFLSNGYPLAALAVARPRPTKGDYLDALRASGALPYLAVESLDAPRLEAALMGMQVDDRDIYARLRERIAQRIPELFT